MKTTARLLAAPITILALLTVGCGDDPTSTEDAAGRKSATSTTADSGTTSPENPSTTSAPSGTGKGDPCRLLTSPEAETILGQPVREPVITERDLGTGAMFDCAYNSVEEPAGPSSVHAGVLGDSFDRGQWEQAQQADGLEPVSGIGELAFYDSGSEKLDVFDGGRWIQVQIINPENPADILTLLTDVARNALKRV